MLSADWLSVQWANARQRVCASFGSYALSRFSDNLESSYFGELLSFITGAQVDPSLIQLTR